MLHVANFDSVTFNRLRLVPSSVYVTTISSMASSYSTKV